jgi:hypothetical protein
MSFVRGSFLQRRLTKLYSDTKSSYENITKGTSKSNEDPTLLSLQRDFRLQKDRLLSWGLDWSDSSAAQPQDIDVSLNQAGFSEVVAGVMSTIQELLNEAERLQEPEEMSTARAKASEAGMKMKQRTNPSDQTRLKTNWTSEEIQRSRQLLKELKSAIDTLYELSRCRSVSRSSQSDKHSRKKSAAESIRSFKSIVESFDPKFSGSRHSLETRNSSFVQSNETLKSQAPSLTPSTKVLIYKKQIHPHQKAPSLYINVSRRPSIGTVATIASFRSAPPVPGIAFQEVSDEDIKAAKNWNDKSQSTHPLYIDRNALDLSSNPPPYEVVVGSSEVRQIGTLKASGIWKHYATPRFEREKSVPVLVEYVPMTSGFKATGMLLPQERLAELAHALQRIYQQRKSNSHMTLLGFLGYFVDLACSRYAFVYLVPPDIPMKWPGFKAGMPFGRDKFEPRTLDYLFKRQERDFLDNPNLDDRFEFAYRLILAILHLRSQNLVHGQINSKNIFFLPDHQLSTYHVRQPFLASFAQFSETGMRPPPEELSCRIYRHPDDQRALNDPAAWTFDLYSLGLVLLEIALWMPIDKLWKPKYDNATFKSRILKIYLHKIPSKCGSLYRDAVKLCLEAADQFGSNTVPNQPTSVSDGLPSNALHPSTSARDKSTISTSYVLQIADKLHRCCAVSETHQAADAELEMFKPSENRVWVSGVTSPIPEHRAVDSGSGAEDQKTMYEAHLRTVQGDLSQKILSLNSLRKDHDSLLSESEKQKTRIAELEKQLEEMNRLQGAPTKEIQQASPGGQMGNPKDFVARARQVVPTRDNGLEPHLEEMYPLPFTPISGPQGMSPEPKMINSFPDESPSDASSPPEPEQQSEVAIAGPSRLQTPPAQSETKSRKSVKKWGQLDIPQTNLDDWNVNLMPRLNILLQKALKNSPESCSASLMMVGDSMESARPTICVTCSSVGKVRAVLKRYFQYDTEQWGLIVVRGDIRRSKQPRRRKRRTRKSPKENDPNPFYQKRPLCGASIGAFRDNEHLPPVSYGGAILVDGVPYGMTVHHMLDAPSDDESECGDRCDTLRSAGPWTNHFDYSEEGFRYCPFDEEPPEVLYPFEISDEEHENDDASDIDTVDLLDDDRFYNDYFSDEETVDDDDVASVGDTSGIEPGEDDQLIVTQPAIDDVDDEYFPHKDEKDEEHLTSHSLGYVHASSGVRRWMRDGIKHEVDWALIRIDNERLEMQNIIPRSPRKSRAYRRENERNGRSSQSGHMEDSCLDHVASLEDLRGLHVHCCGRTSGLQRGRISNAMTLVKMYGRRSFSSSWCVDGNFGGKSSYTLLFNSTQSLLCPPSTSPVPLLLPFLTLRTSWASVLILL